MKQNQFTQAAEDLSKLEVELLRAGYRNETHLRAEYGQYADALGLLWDRASRADSTAESFNWKDELWNDRASQFWKGYHGWVGVVEQLVIAEQEIEAHHAAKQTDEDFSYDLSFCG